MTMTERDWELLQREVDGETSADESAALRERLAHDPELVTHYQALMGVSEALDKVPLTEPPPEMAGDILREVRQQAFAHRPGGIAGVFGRLTARPVLTLATTLAAGLAVGILATHLTDQLRQIDEGAVSGTVLPPADLAGLAVIEEIDLGDSGLGAAVALRRGPDGVVAEVRIRSPRPVDLTVELDPRALRPRGFVSLEDLPTGEVALEEDGVRVRQAPEGRYLLTLAVLGPDPAPLRIRLESGEATLEGQLSVAGPR